MGLECVGVVSVVGFGVVFNGFKVGDRVVVGVFNSYVIRVKVRIVVKILDEMLFEEVVIILSVYCMVIYGLLDLVRLKVG